MGEQQPVGRLFESDRRLALRLVTAEQWGKAAAAVVLPPPLLQRRLELDERPGYGYIERSGFTHVMSMSC